MSLPWPESYWGSYTAVLAAETTGVLLFTLLIQRWIATPRARRATWQGAFLATGLAALMPILSPQLKSWQSKPAERETPTVAQTIAPPAPDAILASKAVPETRSNDPQPTKLTATPFHSVPIAKPSVTPLVDQSPKRIAPTLATTSIPVGEVVWLTFWALGILLLGSRIVLAQILAWHCTRRRSTLEDIHLQPAVRELSARLGCRHPIRLLTSRQLTSPIAFGGWRPTIVVPADFSQDFTAEQQQAMLAHEIAHLTAQDPRWNLLADIVCAALWWNPWVWPARRQLSLASEQAADEASLLVADGAQTLAECLVVLGARLSPARPAHWLGVEGQFRSSLGQRVNRLLNLSGQTWQPTSHTALLFTKLLLPLLLTASVLHSPAWATPQALTEGDPMTAFKQTWRHTFANLSLAAAIHGTTALATEQIEAAPATTNAPTIEEITPATELEVTTESQPNQYQMSEAMRRRYGLTDANQKNQFQMSDDLRRRYGLMPATAKNANANSNEDETQSETEQTAPQPQDSRMNEAMRRRFSFPPGTTHLHPSTAASSEVERKLRETTLTQLDFPKPTSLGKVLEYFSEQTSDLGINFIVSSSQENRAVEINPVTGLPINPINPADIPLQIDGPLAGITLKNALDMITQLTAEPVCYTVNDFGVVFACGNMELKEDGSEPNSQMAAAMMRRYGLKQQIIATNANTQPALATRLRNMTIPQVELKLGTTLQAAAKQISALLNANTNQPNVNLIVQAHSLAEAKVGSNLTLRQVRGLDLLYIVTKVSTLPIQYVFRDNLVFIVPKESGTPNQASLPNSAAPLSRTVQSRTFKLDKQRFDNRLEATFGIPVNKEMEVPARMRQAIVDLANQLGVQFREPGKEIFYNPETGMLLLRAPGDSLDTMAAALQALGGDTPRAF